MRLLEGLTPASRFRPAMLGSTHVHHECGCGVTITGSSYTYPNEAMGLVKGNATVLSNIRERD